MLGIEGLTCGAEIYRFETGGGEMQVRLSVCEVPYSVTPKGSLSTYSRTLLVLWFTVLFYYYYYFWSAITIMKAGLKTSPESLSLEVVSSQPCDGGMWDEAS